MTAKEILALYKQGERSFSNILPFIANLFLNPHAIKSSYWFSPVVFIMLFITLVFWKKIKLDKVLTGLVIATLILWFVVSPLWRFASGIFIFLLVIMFNFVYPKIKNKFAVHIVHFVLRVNILLFLLNVVSPQL